MSKSGIFTSSLAKKYWVALTGLFLITFLIGHLLGNLQLITKTGEEGRRAFNEYAYFMGHNIFIKILAYVTYFSILAHACIGLYLAVQNKKARPQNYAYNRPGTNSSTASRYMAILGTIILVFIVTHMANFWWSQKITETVPLHTKIVDRSEKQQNPVTGQTTVSNIRINYLLTTKGEYIPYTIKEMNQGIYFNPQTGQAVAGKDTALFDVKEVSHLYDKQTGLQVGEGYKDLHTVVMNFFGQSQQGQPTNKLALVAVILYVVSMFVLMFHLWHGFASAFQSLGLNHRKYNGLILFVGRAFSIVVPFLFAIIPVVIYLRR
ncbi:succinate dehydrogenase cytochrome b subunit [Fluviicola sp.]|uniref:succinate dehydrogenase cytochrome b subunit n=1 Tax=Fluviicola sp. TaxID=1917219 RepID=UPI0031D20FCE